MALDDQPYTPPHDGFYTTEAFTDHAIEFLNEAVKASPAKPFFLYLPYNASHWPLQAPDSDIEEYRGKYDQGWQACQCRRCRVAATEFARRQGVDAAATKSLRVSRVHEVGFVELIGGIDLSQRATPLVAERLVGGVTRAIEQQSGLLRLSQVLLEHAQAPGQAPGGSQMCGEFAECGQVFEVGMDVTDIGLILDDRDAEDRRGTGLRSVLAKSAYGRVVTGTIRLRIRRSHGAAGIVVVVIARVELVLLDEGLLILVKQTTHPVEEAAGL